MCHQYATVHDMKDTSRSGNYHNKLFKKIAETHGLHVKCVPKIGWSHTTLTDETAAKLAAFTAENPPTVIYRYDFVRYVEKRVCVDRISPAAVCGEIKRNRPCKTVVSKTTIDLLAVLLVEAHRIRIVDEFAHDARLTARVQYIREDILLVTVIAPAVNDIVSVYRVILFFSDNFSR